MRLILCLLLLALPLTALAEGSKLLGKFGAWEGFAGSDKGAKVCYVASQPTHSTGAPKNRGSAYFTVTHRPADKSIGVINAAVGVALKKDGDSRVEIDGRKFELYVTGDSAWSRDDKSVVAALLKAKSLVMHGIPAKGDPIADSYSLDGFGKAYAAMSKACGVP